MTTEFPPMDADVRESLRKIGDFGPTVRAEEKLVKGYAAWGDDEPGKHYLDSAELRLVGSHLIRAADWLDARAAAALNVERGQ